MKRGLAGGFLAAAHPALYGHSLHRSVGLHMRPERKTREIWAAERGELCLPL